MVKYGEFTIGQTFKSNSIILTKEKIMEFASEFDPQYMHLDEEKANAGLFKGIIASGIQTLAISFKLWIETKTYEEDIIAGTELNNVKFMKPVYPEDELYTVAEVVDLDGTRKSTGIVTVRLSTFNQTGLKVFEGELSAIVRK
ncbi:putative enoyl-CoA hydratase 1 [compost metagenome]